MGRKKESRQSPVKFYPILIIPATIIILAAAVFYIFTRNTFPLSQLYTIRIPSPRPTLTIEIISAQSLEQPQKFYEELALADLSEKLNVARDIIKVVDTQETEFTDASLGCPERNNFYAQVVTPGYVITLDVLGQPYTYNAGLNRVVSCNRS